MTDETEVKYLDGGYRLTPLMPAERQLPAWFIATLVAVGGLLCAGMLEWTEIINIVP